MSAVDCIDGMKLCGGDAVIKGCQIERCSGSGLVFESSTNKCMISNARIENCYNGILCLEGSIVNVASSSISRCGASGVVSRHNCNILLDSVNIDGAQENIVNLAEFCNIKVSQCKFQCASGAGVVVSQQSACVLQDSTISDCGGAGVESAGKVSMSATKCIRNSNGVVLLQLTEASLTNCTFSDNNFAGVWSIGDSCDVRGCAFEGNRCCAYTAGKDTVFVEEMCTLQSNGSSSSFLVWKTGKRSSVVQVGALALLSSATRASINFCFLWQADIIAAALSHANRAHFSGVGTPLHFFLIRSIFFTFFATKKILFFMLMHQCILCPNLPSRNRNKFGLQSWTCKEKAIAELNALLGDF